MLFHLIGLSDKPGCLKIGRGLCASYGLSVFNTIKL